MAVYVPPGFFDFIMGLNDEEADKIMSARDIMNGNSKAPNEKVTRRIPKPKRTRKVSKYQRAFGKHLKQLKKNHPRTSISILMKRAHRLTRKEMK